VSENPSALCHWLDRLRDGDPAARNEVIRHSRERLRLLTHQMLRNYPGVGKLEDTSDVLQNVLIRLDRALGVVPLESPRDFLRLATATIRRELIDLARHYLGPEGEGAHLDPAATVLDRPDRRNDPYRLALWREVHTKIETLNPDHRELFELLYYQGLTQAQAIDLLGLPRRSLQRRWQAARLELMSRLGGETLF
jgi:RNA polymerase sigma-70 factor (ECF subfamily)